MKRKAESTVGGSNKNRVVECPHCQKKMRSDKLKGHILTHNIMKPCKFCKKDFRSDRLLKHEVLCHSNVDESLCDRLGVEHVQPDACSSSVSGYFTSYPLEVSDSLDYDTILSNACEAARTTLHKLLKSHPVKAQIVVTLSFYKQSLGGKEISEKTFRSLCEPLLMGDSVDPFFTRVKIYIQARIEEYERFGSGWIFDTSNCAHLEIAKYTPLSGSGTVKIPRQIKRMRSVLNISSPDNKCFVYCLAAKLQDPVKSHPDRYTKYLKTADTIRMGTVGFPVKISEIPKIEELNNLSISVFQWDTDENCVIPLKHGSGIGIQIDLLYIQDDSTAHYMLIKDFNAFMRHRTKYHNSMFYCRKCLHGFTNKCNHAFHSDKCKQGINQCVKMPKPGVIEFKAQHKQEKKNFVLYFDFESLTVPYQRCDPNPVLEQSSTESYQKHIPCSFSIVTKSEFADYKEENVVYSNEDPDKVVQTFISELSRIHGDMMKCYAENQHPIDMSEENEKQFRLSKNCHICKKELQWDSVKNYPVRDHDHTKKSSNFRGAACNICNRNYFERSKIVPAFAHNLTGYDMNLFILDLIKAVEKIEVIPENIEKFKAIFTDDFIFLDSLAFLPTSLDKLAENLKSSGLDSFKRMQKEFPDDYELLSKKGTYFYDYSTSFSIFSETELPPKDEFYSRLKEESISDKDYDHAKDVFAKMGCTTLLDYMELYVKTDAVLLCDIFENFRSLCMEYYGLDPCHFMSLPAFSWEAMLKMTGVKLEHITDLDQYTFLEDNLRGGITTINHRHFKANNKYLDEHNSDLASSYIHYIDANNLYGAGMSSKLPTGNFRWVETEDLENLDFMEVDPDGETCYILEVDLEYPSDIHDFHNDYPLAVESKMIEEVDLSPYNRNFLDKHCEKFKSSKKLCPDLKNKENYVCSLKNLQLFIRLGLTLKKIHRVLAADQSDFLRPYIEFNSLKRQQATSKFTSDFFKLCNNSIYGKTIEDLRKRSKVDIVKEEKEAKRLISRPQFKGFHILDEDVTIVQSMKSTITLNKPIGCGFMVLENAKHIMGQFWYTVLKPKYGDKLKLLLSDTDSFVYAVYTEDGYKDLYDLREYMDLSGYSKTSVLGSFRDPSNKKVPGKFSDEKPNEIIREVIALKPKMYSVSTKVLECNKKVNDPNHNCTPNCFSGHTATAKGVKNSAKKSITHEDYRNVLETSGTTMTTARTIRAYNHKLYSIVINKRGLSAYDDKKYVMDNGVDTCSYGHYKLQN